MYNILISNNAKKQLSKLPSTIQNRIDSVFERIKIRPFHFIKRKQGSPYFILRIGEYRVILDIKQTKLIILVIEVGHRKNIYKNKYS
jgi:mRNA interferase RelE/StbE|tara:strand:+ start:330 stop:590 length:261 start_codon:yes stop_codon:yes gene_type:complete